MPKKKKICPCCSEPVAAGEKLVKNKDFGGSVCEPCDVSIKEEQGIYEEEFSESLKAEVEEHC